MICIHIMWNDICLPCCHHPHTLFQDISLYSLLQVPISTQIIATITKNSIHNIQYERYQHIEIWVGTSLMS